MPLYLVLILMVLALVVSFFVGREAAKRARERHLEELVRRQREMKARWVKTSGPNA